MRLNDERRPSSAAATLTTSAADDSAGHGEHEGLKTAREIGERIGLSSGTVLDWWEAGRIPGYRLGGRKGGPVRFAVSEIEACLADWHVEARA